MKDTILKYLEITAKGAGYSEPKSIASIIGGLIALILSFLGLIFLILIIYAGFLWMMAGGNDNKILIAKKIIVNATIGLALVLASYSITHFVLSSLVNVVG